MPFHKSLVSAFLTGGKVWIDEYIDNPYHDPNKKTLALIDLKQISIIERILSDLGIQLNKTITDYNTYNGVGASISKSQRYGYDPNRDQELTIDLYDLTLHLDKSVPQDSSSLSSLRQAIFNAVVYERNDGTRPGSHGISIFSPRMKVPADFDFVTKSVPVSEEWEHFIKHYMTFVSQDDSKPVIFELGDGKFQVTDDKGLAYVRIDTDWLPDIINLSHSYGLKSEPVTEFAPGIYIPAPDDQTFYLKDTSTGETVPFFHLFIGRDSQGQENYFGYVQIMRGGKVKEAVINPIRNTTTQDITYTLYPYEIKENGEMIFSKVPATLKQGDVIIPKLVERFLISDNPPVAVCPV